MSVAARIDEGSKARHNLGSPASIDYDHIPPNRQHSIRLNGKIVIPLLNLVSGFSALDDALFRIDPLDKHPMALLLEKAPKYYVDDNRIAFKSGVAGWQS